MQPVAPAAPPVWGASPSWSGPATPAPSKETDLQALGRIKLAAIIGILGAALGITYPLVANLTGSSFLVVPTSGGGVPSVNTTGLYSVLGAAVTGVFLSVLALVYLRGGFVQLRSVDRRFGSTPTFVLLALIAFVIVGLGLVVLLAGLVQLLNCVAGLSTIPSSCLTGGAAGALFGGLGLLVVGAILLLVGGIGTVIGVWRLGDRYQDGLFKAAAILWIFFAVVGAILLLIAAMHAETAVRQAPAVAATPGPFVPPPPPSAPR